MVAEFNICIAREGWGAPGAATPTLDFQSREKEHHRNRKRVQGEVGRESSYFHFRICKFEKKIFTQTCWSALKVVQIRQYVSNYVRDA